MAEACLSCYRDPSVHEAVSALIRRRSTNRADVRAVALDGLELSHLRSVLDLGCGFGFMTEAVAPRVAVDAQVVGVDVCPENEAGFLARVAAAGRTGRFVCRRVEQTLDWPDRSVDLVLASYSLYFFPRILPEIARVLTPAGLFLAITHTEHSCHNLPRAIGYEVADWRRLSQIDAFCAENGAAALAGLFDEVERVDYPNTLTFAGGEIDDLLTYLRFKLPVLVPGTAFGEALPEELPQAVQVAVADAGRVVVDKSDAIFRCRKPRCL